MKYLQQNNLKLPHLVMGAIRLKIWGGAQCAVLFGRSKSDAAKDVLFVMRRVK